MNIIDTRRSRVAAACAALAAAVMAACGGGGGDAGAPIPENVSITVPASAEQGSAVSLRSSASGSAGLTHAWDFGDGATSVEAAPRHTYARSGDYDIGLTVTRDGQTRRATATLAVHNRALVQGRSCVKADGGGWCALRPDFPLTGLAMLDRQRLFATTEDGLLASEDGGRTWSLRSFLYGTEDPAQLQFTDADHGWLLAGYPYAIRSTADGGRTWQLAWRSTEFIGQARHFLFLDNRRGLAVTYDGGGPRMFSTDDGGANWTGGFRFKEYTNGMHFLDGQRGVIVGEVGLIATTADGGSTWTYRQSGTTVDLEGVTAAGSTLWAWGETTVLTSTDAGLTWSPVTKPPLDSTHYPSSLVFTDARRGWFSNYFGVVHTQDGGKTWQRQDLGTAIGFTRMLFPDSRTGYGLGDGVLMATGTGGE